MSRDIWNPRQYRAYSSHRARPFFELLARVDVETPAYVVDLGCGPGERTADLAIRWPNAVIEGIDSSPEMITEAHRTAGSVEAGERAGASAQADGGLPEDAGGGSLENAGGRSFEDAGGRSFEDDGGRSFEDDGGRSIEDLGGGSFEDAGGGSFKDAGRGPFKDAGGVVPTTRPGAGRRGAGVSSFGISGASADDDSGGMAPRGDGSSPDSPEGDGAGTLRFSVGDLTEWVPDRPVDVIFSNAALQWVPDHQRLLPRWVEALAPGGRLAFSMPGNFDGPSHRILRELCDSPRWRDRLGQVNRHDVVGDPADYFTLLSDLGCEVDAWETTYLQVLHGPDPVLEWMKGTALRPAFDALPDEDEHAEFLAELTPLLREAYPPGPHGTLFPFRRVFVMAGPAAPASRPS